MREPPYSGFHYVAPRSSFRSELWLALRDACGVLAYVLAIYFITQWVRG